VEGSQACDAVAVAIATVIVVAVAACARAADRTANKPTGGARIIAIVSKANTANTTSAIVLFPTMVKYIQRCTIHKPENATAHPNMQHDSWGHISSIDRTINHATGENSQHRTTAGTLPRATKS
jgi:hypothetical protein